jgi:hypothetical protein
MSDREPRQVDILVLAEFSHHVGFVDCDRDHRSWTKRCERPRNTEIYGIAALMATNPGGSATATSRSRSLATILT